MYLHFKVNPNGENNFDENKFRKLVSKDELGPLKIKNVVVEIKSIEKLPSDYYKVKMTITNKRMRQDNRFDETVDKVFAGHRNEGKNVFGCSIKLGSLSSARPGYFLLNRGDLVEDFYVVCPSDKCPLDFSDDDGSIVQWRDIQGNNNLFMKVWGERTKSPFFDPESKSLKKIPIPAKTADDQIYSRSYHIIQDESTVFLGTGYFSSHSTSS